MPDRGEPAHGCWCTHAGAGTAAMLAAASYTNPFETAAESCTLTCIPTQGPCWAPSAPLRQDISEGEPGIPLRLMRRCHAGVEDHLDQHHRELRLE